MSLTCDTDDVRSSLLDSSESFCCAGNCLVDNDSLHERIVCKTCNDTDCCLLLFHEVIRICKVLDHAAFVDRTVLCDKSFGTSEVILRLGNSTCYDTDVEFFRNFYSRSSSCCLFSCSNRSGCLNCNCC